MATRKNLRGGCVLKRVCIYQGESPNAREICHLSRLLPFVSQRVRSGDLVFPPHTPRNVKRVLKFTLTKVGPEGSPEFTDNPIRMGGYTGVLTSGNSLEVIRGPVGRRGSVFRSYVDIAMGRAFRISRALIAISGDSSSADERVTKDVSDKRRRRWRETAA